MIYPIRYYYRGGVSDKKFILARMAHIPEDKQQEVSDHYDKLYMQDGSIRVAKGRKEANIYLHNEARKYQAERTPDAYNRHLEKMKGMVKRDHPTVKKKMSSGVVNQSALPKGVKGIQLDW